MDFPRNSLKKKKPHQNQLKSKLSMYKKTDTPIFAPFGQWFAIG
jgi:hypothetical protein